MGIAVYASHIATVGDRYAHIIDIAMISINKTWHSASGLSWYYISDFSACLIKQIPPAGGIIIQLNIIPPFPIMGGIEVSHIP